MGTKEGCLHWPQQLRQGENSSLLSVDALVPIKHMRYQVHSAELLSGYSAPLTLRPLLPLRLEKGVNVGLRDRRAPFGMWSEEALEALAEQYRIPELLSVGWTGRRPFPSDAGSVKART